MRSRLLGLYSQASPWAWEHLTFSRHRIVIIAQHLCFVKGFCKVFRRQARNSQNRASPSGGTGKGRNPPAGEKPARRRRTSLTGAGMPTYGEWCRPRDRRQRGAEARARRRGERSRAGNAGEPSKAQERAERRRRRSRRAARHEAAPGWACYLCGDALSSYLIDSYIIPSRVPKKLV